MMICLKCQKAEIDGYFCRTCGQVLMQGKTESINTTLFERNIEYFYEDGHSVLLSGSDYVRMIPPKLQAIVWPQAAEEIFLTRYCLNEKHHKCNDCGRNEMGDASYLDSHEFYCEYCEAFRSETHSAPSDASCGENFEWHWEKAVE